MTETVTASADDYRFMAHALRLARRGLYTTDPNPRVGCVLVKGGAVIGEGWHVRTGAAHAEINALTMAGGQARGATAYVTLEPCRHYGRTPPCTDALLAAGITRVVTAMEDPYHQVAGGGLEQLRRAGVTVECGLLATEARALNPGFIKRLIHGHPYVRTKLAMSLDGRTAMASGESQWITGEAARQDGQRLRARSSAVMTGIGTVLADDPSLNVRLNGQAVRQPLRVIVDPELSIPPQARCLRLDGQALVFTAVTEPRAWAPLQAVGAEVMAVPRQGEGLDLRLALAELARREMNEVHLECGATLAGAMLEAGLLDELIIYLAPRLLGDGARGLFHLPGLTRMSQSIPLTIVDIRAVGPDWRITAQPATGSLNVE